MALTDLVESTYITKWKKQKENGELRKRILFKAIRLTEEYQRINDAARATADALVNGFFKMSFSEQKAFLLKHQFNLVVYDCGDGSYNLLTGLISYMALQTIFEKKEKAFYRKKEKEHLEDEWKEKELRVFVTNFKTRPDFLSHCKKTLDISFNADMDYIVEENLSRDAQAESEEYEKLINDKSYRPTVSAIQLDRRLYITENEFAYFAAKKAGREKIRVFIKADSVVKTGPDEKENSEYTIIF